MVWSVLFFPVRSRTFCSVGTCNFTTLMNSSVIWICYLTISSWLVFLRWFSFLSTTHSAAVNTPAPVVSPHGDVFPSWHLSVLGASLGCHTWMGAGVLPVSTGQRPEMCSTLQHTDWIPHQRASLTWNASTAGGWETPLLAHVWDYVCRRYYKK